MIHQLIHRLLLRRHFWRYATFSEVAELYASRMLRMLAINMTAAFMSIFLYQNGYSIKFIAVYWALFFTNKAVLALPLASYVARFGPKHGTLWSNLLYIPSMIMYTLVPHWGLPALAVAGFLQGTSSALYNICYMIDFSKVKSINHAGKEIAYMNIVEKVATGLSPFIGGALAFIAGPQATMVAAALLFTFASVPLFKTGEPIRTGQRLDFRDFPWRLVWRSMIAEAAIGFDALSSGTVWTLLIGIVILGTNSNQVYAELGVLLSVVLLVALLSSYVYGQLIDRRRGRELLRYAVLADALVHYTRPFVVSPVVVAGVNAANETATTGYMMAFTRGMFDTADLSGRRVAYLGCMEVVSNFGAVLACLTLFAFACVFDGPTALKSVFFVTGTVVLLIATPRFRLYQK